MPDAASIGLGLLAVLALLLAARVDRRRLAGRLPGFWGDPAAKLHRIDPGPEKPGLLRTDPAAGGPAGSAATPCQLRGFRRLVCGGDSGRVGLDGRRIFWDSGAVWLRQGL